MVKKYQEVYRLIDTFIASNSRKLRRAKMIDKTNPGTVGHCEQSIYRGKIETLKNLKAVLGGKP